MAVRTGAVVPGVVMGGTGSMASPVTGAGAVIHAPPMSARGSMPTPRILGASGGVATAGGGDVSVAVVRPDAYAVGRTIRRTVDPKGDTTYVATMAGTGAIVGTVLTGGAEWGAGIGFVTGWIVGVRQLRRR